MATIFTFVLASLFHSQFVMAELTSVGVVISFTDRLSMSLDDLIGLSPTYGIVIAISFLLAFSVSSLIINRFKLPSSALYFVGGGIGIAIALLAMQPILDVTLIAGARSTFGFVCQSLAGAIGGWVFSHLRNEAKGTSN
jgi:hypothetical protein